MNRENLSRGQQAALTAIELQCLDANGKWPDVYFTTAETLTVPILEARVQWYEENEAHPVEVSKWYYGPTRPKFGRELIELSLETNGIQTGYGTRSNVLAVRVL